MREPGSGRSGLHGEISLRNVLICEYFYLNSGFKGLFDRLGSTFYVLYPQFLVNNGAHNNS